MFETLRSGSRLPETSIDRAMAALEFFGIGETKEQREEKKLRKKRERVAVDFRNDINWLQRHGVHLEKIIHGLGEHFSLIRSEIKNKKFDSQKLQSLGNEEDWIIPWSEGRSCVKNLPRYNSYIKEFISKPFTDEVEEEDDDLKSAESIFETALYDHNHGAGTTYARAGYENFIPEFLGLQATITTALTQLHALNNEAIEYCKKAYAFTNSCTDVGHIEAVRQRSRAVCYFITDRHPVTVVQFLVYYALDIVKHCYE